MLKIQTRVISSDAQNILKWMTDKPIILITKKKSRTKQLKHPLSEVTLMHYARCLVHLLIIISQNIHHCMQDWILTDNCRWVAWIVAGDGSEFKLYAILCLSWFHCQVMSGGLSNILEDGGSNKIPSACQFYTGQSQDKPTPMLFPWTFVERSFCLHQSPRDAFTLRSRGQSCQCPWQLAGLF